MNFLGLDIGTSAVKAVIVDGDQRVLASAGHALDTQRPHRQWSEQDPQAWWRAVESVVAQLRQAPPTLWCGIGAIGLSGQMHGAVLLDAAGEIIRPAILWNDGRAHAQARELNAAVPGLGRIAGVPAMAGFTAPKLLWLARHEPRNVARLRWVLAPKDYIRFRMTGEIATDMCDAAGMLWLDEARRQWSEAIVSASGLSLDRLPRLLEGSQISGTLRAEWGLGPVPVAAGAGDAAAGAIGIGAVKEGDAFISLGTSAQYFVTTESYRPRPQEFIHAFAHALPGRWSQIAALLNGASCLAWAASLVRGASIESLLNEAECAYGGPGEVVFLPYLTGERTPHDDPNARGVLFGLTPGVAASHLIQAVLEGVALSLADAQECLARSGTLTRSLGVIGGGARSPFWMRLLADILDRPLDLYEESESGPAFGAARLARLAVTGEDPAAVCVRPKVAATIPPDPRRVAAYRGHLGRFRSLYRALEPEFRRGPA